MWIPSWRLKRALARPFPDDWARILKRNNPAWRRLPEPQRHALEQRIKQFLHEKHFAGAGGLTMTDEIRVTIAGEACLLLINRHDGVYPGLRWIVVYPSAFIVERDDIDEDGLVSEGAHDLLGESWGNGKVILAWDHVLHGARRFDDGRNVVLHEFAHQLDQETGSTDGAPVLAGQSSYRNWAATFSAEFESLQRRIERGSPGLLDEYGATHPAEFFAVATEAFFEQPVEMARHHEGLFEALMGFYRVDPREWH